MAQASQLSLPSLNTKPMSNQTWKVAESIGVEQARAMDEILALLDAAVPTKFLALFGGRNSASVLLNELLGKQLMRTPGRRKIFGMIVDATRLPSHVEAWQFLLFAVMDKLAESPTATHNIIGDLRDELNELIQLERRRDESASLASAAFAHHFRTAFPGLVSASVATSNGLLVIGLDRLEQVDGVFAMDLLEAARYFLHSPDCATVMAADERALMDKLKVVSASAERMMATWPTERVAVPERIINFSGKAPLRPGSRLPEPAAAVTGGKRQTLGTLPSDSAKIIKELLSPDQRAIDKACDEWHGAIAALAKRNEEGYATKISGAQIAKLLGLKLLSPRLFDAAKFDATLLSRLERSARSGQADMKDENQRLMALNPQLTALFKSAPNFVGVEPRDMATALRMVSGREAEPAASKAAQTKRVAGDGVAEAQTAKRERSAPAVNFALPLVAPIVVLIASTAAIVALDRFTKIWAAATPVLPNMTTSSIISNAAMLGMELLGLALSALILGFWGAARRSPLYHAAFGLIIGGLGSNLYDHINTGGVLNFVLLGGLSLNVAHVGLLCGALCLIVAMFQREK